MTSHRQLLERARPYLPNTSIVAAEIDAALAQPRDPPGCAAPAGGEPVAWTVKEQRLIRQSVLLYAERARDAWNAYAQKGPHSDLEKSKSAGEDAKLLESIYARMIPATTTPPAVDVARLHALTSAIERVKYFHLGHDGEVACAEILVVADEILAEAALNSEGGKGQT